MNLTESLKNSTKKNTLIQKKAYHIFTTTIIFEKIKDETRGVAIEKFVELKAEMYLFMVEDNSRHKKQKVWIEMLLQQ